jgi:hypothetical protein
MGDLSVEDLNSASGGGLVDSVLSDTEATTGAFLKKFAETSLTFSTFINSPAQTPPPNNAG